MAGLPVVHCYFFFQGAFVVSLELTGWCSDWACAKHGLLVWAGYSALAALLLFCMIGTMRLLACWLFVRFAYAPMKVRDNRHLHKDIAASKAALLCCESWSQLRTDSDAHGSSDEA